MKEQMGRPPKVKSAERTPWFHGAILPARPGVYERQYKMLGIKFNYWDGKSWGSPGFTISRACECRYSPSNFQRDLLWRGLLKRTAKAKSGVRRAGRGK